MDTELLETFLGASRTRHSGRAAEAPYLTQSAASFRIKQLENQLGANLLTRHRNNIRLTTAGERLLPYAGMLMNMWRATRKEVANTSRHNEFSIGASVPLWECTPSGWLGCLYQSQEPQSGLQFEVRIVQWQSLVKQPHERQLDLLITTEVPKMDKFSSQLLGYFTSVLYCNSPPQTKDELNYLRPEWGPDFQQHKAGLIAGGEVPVLTTNSAELARQQPSVLKGFNWLPVSWARGRSDLHMVIDSTMFLCPLYTAWLRNSDKHAPICDLLRMNTLED